MYLEIIEMYLVYRKKSKISPRRFQMSIKGQEVVASNMLAIVCWNWQIFSVTELDLQGLELKQEIRMCLTATFHLFSKPCL